MSPRSTAPSTGGPPSAGPQPPWTTPQGMAPLPQAAGGRPPALHHRRGQSVAHPAVDHRRQRPAARPRRLEGGQPPRRPRGRGPAVGVGAGHGQRSHRPAQGPDHRVVGPTHAHRPAAPKAAAQVDVEPPASGDHQGQGPGQKRSASSRAAGSRSPATASTCPGPATSTGRATVGRPLLQGEQPLHRVRPGTGRRPARRRCRWGRPPPRRPGASSAARATAAGSPAAGRRGHLSASPPASGCGRPGPARSGPPPNPARRAAPVAASAWWGAISTTSAPPGRSHRAAPATTASTSAMPPAPPVPSAATSARLGLPLPDPGVEPGQLVLRPRTAGWTPPGRTRPATARAAGRRTTTPAASAPGRRCPRSAVGQAGEVGRRHLERRCRAIGGPDLEARPRRPGLHGQRQGDGPRAGAEVGAPRRPTRPAGAAQDRVPARPGPPRPPARSPVGGSAPGGRPCSSMERNGHGPQHVLQRLAGQAPLRQSTERRLPSGRRSTGRAVDRPRGSTGPPGQATRRRPPTPAGRGRGRRPVARRPPSTATVTPRRAAGPACRPSGRRSARRGRPSAPGRACAGSA